jgi:hypothetical protein
VRVVLFKGAGAISAWCAPSAAAAAVCGLAPLAVCHTC